nr:unnamed protein product [Digitaria exilis]
MARIIAANPATAAIVLATATAATVPPDPTTCTLKLQPPRDASSSTTTASPWKSHADSTCPCACDPSILLLVVSGDVGVRVQHAPPPGKVLDARRRCRHCRPADAVEVERKLWAAVEGEETPVALEVARRDALGVLVDEPKQNRSASADVACLSPSVGQPTSPIITGRCPNPIFLRAETSVSKLASNTFVYTTFPSTTGFATFAAVVLPPPESGKKA